MDLQIDVCNDINEKEWNSVVHNSKHGSIFHTFEWVDVLEKEFGKKILIGAWLNGKLVGIFPCIIGSKDQPTKHIRSFRLGFDYGGPVSTIDDRQIIMELISKFEEIAKKEAYKATIATTLDFNFATELEALGYTKEMGATFIVDLKKSVDELWRNLDRSARKSIRKASEQDFCIRSVKNRIEIEKYYELFMETAKRAGFGPDSRSKNFYYNIWDNLHEKGLAKIFIVEENNETISELCVLLFKKTITAFCSGTLNKYLSLQPNSLLFWHVIEWGHKNGFEYFDLAGADLPDLYRFKKKWGGNLTNYYLFTKTYPSLSYRFLMSYYNFRRSFYKIKNRLFKK